MDHAVRCTNRTVGVPKTGSSGTAFKELELNQSNHRSLAQLVREILELDVLDLVPRLTLILLITHPISSRSVLTVLCAAAILLPAFYRSAYFWLLVTGAMFAGVFTRWYEVDNHVYLMTYWCLALSLSLAGNNPRRALRINARLLVGLCFLFAAFWKGISDDFLSGEFFQHTLLTDARFKNFAGVAGGVSDEAFRENAKGLAQLADHNSRLESIQLKGSPRLGSLSVALTWTTIGLEGLIALAFLCPSGYLLSRWRHALLVAFGLGTYALAPVVGFGWLLMVMGLAQCSQEQKRARAFYIITFFIIQIYSVPWGAFAQWLA